MTPKHPAGKLCCAVELKSGQMAIILYENFRAVFYAPFYAAFARDAFAEEGIDVRLETSDAPGVTARNRDDSAPAVWWGGPMRIPK